MSNNIGKKPIKIPSDIKLTIVEYPKYNTIILQSANILQISYPKGIDIKLENELLYVNTDSKELKAYWGSLTSIIQSMIIGLSEGYTRKLLLKGVGYRFETTEQKNKYKIFVGYTIPIIVEIPLDIETKLINNTTLEGKSIDKHRLTNYFNKIRILKASDRDKYKGKGIQVSE